MQNKYITVSQQVKELYKLGVSSYDIVNHIVDDWDLSVIKATVMVDYVLNDELYKDKKEDD